MKWSRLAWCLGVALVIFTPVAWRVLSWEEAGPQPASLADQAAGSVLFAHEWQPNDPLSNGGDGLGPVYNANSCVACHSQGGTGGAGGLEHNVTTFVVERFRNGRRKEGVIHAHATSEEHQETLALLSSNLPAISQPTLGQLGIRRTNQPCQPLNHDDGVTLSQRNTPALFGAGLIDAIPDRVILANAKKQRLRYGMAPGKTRHLPVGRPSRMPDGRVGKFGWKAQAAGLGDFVEAACANELGLSNPTHQQPRSLANPGYQAVCLDLTQKQCDQITAFVAALPRPEERLPANPALRAEAEHGKTLFRKLGCADCHTPDLGSVSGIYSDLLLHRMGDDLQGGGSSYGGSPPPSENLPDDGPLASEWRTPPLWGVADSGPYLHDGRAATLEEAIKLHGGQGATAAANFQRLSPQGRNQLLGFLRTLRAPAAVRKDEG